MFFECVDLKFLKKAQFLFFEKLENHMSLSNVGDEVYM